MIATGYRMTVTGGYRIVVEHCKFEIGDLKL